MSEVDIYNIIERVHNEGDPDSLDGLVDIFRTIYEELGGTSESDWWSMDAMLAVLDAALGN